MAGIWIQLILQMLRRHSDQDLSEKEDTQVVNFVIHNNTSMGSENKVLQSNHR